jgi:hypothetical protein
MPSFKINFGYRVTKPRLKYLIPVIEGWGKALKRDAIYQSEGPCLLAW